MQKNLRIAVLSFLIQGQIFRRCFFAITGSKWHTFLVPPLYFFLAVFTVEPNSKSFFFYFIPSKKFFDMWSKSLPICQISNLLQASLNFQITCGSNMRKVWAEKEIEHHSFYTFSTQFLFPKKKMNLIASHIFLFSPLLYLLFLQKWELLKWRV